MSDWTKNNPSSIVRVILTGNKDLARMYMHEAKNLLYILKNRMGLGGLDSLVHPVVLPDGTSIKVSSSYGVDQISIDSPSIEAPEVRDVTEEEEENRCSIKINTPTVVQPMRYPGEIRHGEISGTDFIKTVYRMDLSQCPECRSIVWRFLFQYKKPTDPRYFHNVASIPQMGVEPGESDPTNHSVYSLDPPCWGEIIKRVRFNNSSGYIVWKAYTEGSLGTEFARIGLGILLLTAEISGPDGKILCSAKKKIDVDCCHKDPSIRKAEIWWEGVGECQPFIMYNNTHICKMPVTVSVRELMTYSTPFYAAQLLYAIPDIKGGCLPFEWIFTGPIKPIATSFLGASTYFQLTSGPGDCFASVTITLKDRCGTFYSVYGVPACFNAAPMTLSYTSLLMSCGQSQWLYAIGGVAPYTWSVGAGGGTIEQDAFNGAVYHAPATNVNCTNNPTITVTDCCGSSASISLAINCYNGPESSTKIANLLKCCCYKLDNPGCGGMVYNEVHTQLLQAWDCRGNSTQNCWTGNRSNCGGVCPPPPPCVNDCSCQSTDESGCWGDPGYSSGSCQGGGYAAFDTLTDVRSSGMKAGGCCPLNPLTGLPY